VKGNRKEGKGNIEEGDNEEKEHFSDYQEGT